jgi:N6-L-threonylcarbamoyladenine synthase
MILLGIESTCDETAAAVVADGVGVRSSAIATQFELHEKFRGVVPEIASRAHIENIMPVIKEATDSAGVRLQDVDAIAVAQRPGLIGSLLIGVTAAKTLAWSLGKPLVAVDHVQSHLYSVMLCEEGQVLRGKGQVAEKKSGADTSSLTCPLPLITCPFPSIGLVCSGGHTALYLINSWLDVQLVGSTIDDAVGEAYDKVAAMLGLPFPGGPAIDQLAARGDPKSLDLPRSMLGRDSLDFSFSGLKTAVRYQVFGYQGKERKIADLSENEIENVAASFQAACVDTLVKKIIRAAKQFDAKSIIVGGGVSANRGLRAALQQLNWPVFLPPMKYCTDNAAMIAGLGHVLLQAGRVASLDMDAVTQSSIPRR